MERCHYLSIQCYSFSSRIGLLSLITKIILGATDINCHLQISGGGQEEKERTPCYGGSGRTADPGLLMAFVQGSGGTCPGRSGSGAESRGSGARGLATFQLCDLGRVVQPLCVTL